MPRDNKTPLIQKIAKQAYITLKGLASSANDADKQNELISLVTAVRAADLKIAPRKSKPSSGAAGLQSPPVTYMHICETEVFSMGVFLLRTGASIPLHDHPDMNGMLKGRWVDAQFTDRGAELPHDSTSTILIREHRMCLGPSDIHLYPEGPLGKRDVNDENGSLVLYGKVSVRCFDKLKTNLTVNSVPPHFDPPLAPLQTASLWRSILRSVAEYSENSGPCLLTPLRDNLHQIDAVEGPAAFLDILAPPYNPDDGRDCHYYKLLQTVAERETNVKSNEEQQEEEKEKEEESWLLEVPQPEDFWCGGEPYPGPAVSI